MDRAVTSFSQDFFFLIHAVFFFFANSAQVHGNWPELAVPGCGRVRRVEGAEDEDGCSGS